MLTYTIKKDGYPLGQAKGKHEAVKRIKKEMEFWSIDHLARWENNAGEIKATVENQGVIEVYTAEEERG